MLAYESTVQFGGSGDLLGCDSPQQGGFTHGHVVSTTALGNGTDVAGGYGLPWFAFDTQGDPWDLDGVAMRAKLVAYDGQVTPPTVSCGDPLQDTITPGDLWNAVTPTSSSLGKAYVNHNARIFNFSWGSTANVYGQNSRDIDEFIADNRDAMVFVSAGNNGGQDQDQNGEEDFLTLGSPATTKNGLAIGASRNANIGVNSPESREAFSSKGPAVDFNTVNRIAPQLMAPGGEPGGGALGISSEFACRSNDNDQNDPVQCDIIQGVEGTSFSSPAAAGTGLVVRDYFSQGFYPDKSQNEADRTTSISGALVKAVLVAAADFMDTPPGANLNDPFRFNNEQGYGRIQLDHALPLENWPDSPSGLIVHDPYSGTSNLSLAASLAPNTSTSTTFTVCNDTERLAISLAWTDDTDPNGDLINDLNLTVVSPTGKEYRGNYFTDDGNRSGLLEDSLLYKEDCPPLGSRTNSAVLDVYAWSIPVCQNTKIPGLSDIGGTFDRTNPTEAIFLSPDPEGNNNVDGYIPEYFDGICDGLSSNPGGVNGFGLCSNDQDCSSTAPSTVPTDFCNGGTKQPEIGDWTITVASANTSSTVQDFAVVITGGVCLGSSVRFNQGSYSCNQEALVQVSELAEVSDPGCGTPGTCPTATIEARTTVRAYDALGAEVDCEGPGCLPAGPSLTFTQNSGSLVFVSDAVNLTDGTVPTPGNGTLDIRDGYRVEVVYDDVDGVLTKTRKSSAVVGCQVAIGYGATTFVQWGQDSAVAIQGGCELAPKRHERCVGGTCEASGGSCSIDSDCPKFPLGYFEYGFPDRYMDAGEIINFNVAFNSEETIDLNNVQAALRCVNVDADSPAACLPSGAGCDPVECGGTCDPRRKNNTTCPYMSILNTPQFLGLVPTGQAMTANFSIQMAGDNVFGATTPTVEMLLEITADTSGRTASGIAVARQRLNVDTDRKLYHTDFPTGGVSAEVLDMNNNEREDNPITDLAGYQALDLRFETKSYSDMTISGRNLNLLSPWNFDGNNGGFTNGLNGTTDEAGAQSNLIANWGEDKNFNGIEDGQCLTNPAIGCWAFPNDARCPGAGNCVSIENNNNDGFFTQNHNQKGGCGWQTKAPFTCTAISDRGCFGNEDCKGVCQLTANSILSTFDPCTGATCPQVNQCNASLSPINDLGTCTTEADCGCNPGDGCCEAVDQTCVNDAGTCDLLDPASTGGAWHTGRIGTKGIGDCLTAQCQRFKVITSNNGNLTWWELLLTPIMEKVDQSETNGIPNSDVNIAYWGWNMSMDLPDSQVLYTWEFDTDVETLFPVDLVADGTVLNFGRGAYGPVANENNPALTNGFNLFASMGRCSDVFCSIDGLPCITTADCAIDVCDVDAGVCTLGGNACVDNTVCTTVQTCPGVVTPTGTCTAATDCAKGACTAPASGEPCSFDADCEAIAGGSTCSGADGCVQLSTSYNGSDPQGNNRDGANSCFFEGVGTIPPEAFQFLGTARPRDDDMDNDGDGFIDEFLTADGPLRTHDIVSFNGPDMRLFTLEDLFGDTGNSFQASLGLLNLEGVAGTPASQGFGLAVDDMYVEWFEFTQSADTTTCSTGQCATLDVPSGVIYEGVTSLPVSLLDSSPYGSACTGGANNGIVCFAANGNADCPSGFCLPAFNDCDLDGLFNTPGVDDIDCNNNGTPDVVVKATSEVDTAGEIVILDQVSPGSNEYRGNVAVSVLADSEGVVYLVQVGTDNPFVLLTYLDYDDGTGHICQNDVVDDNRGRVQNGAGVLVQTCDVSLVSTSFVDNGDVDLFADSQETIDLSFSVQNNCGFLLTNCVARLSSNSPEVECIKTGQVALGDLPGASVGAGPVIASPTPFVFKLDDALADRTTQGLTANDALSAAFNVAISCTEIDGLDFPQNFSMTLDLNLNDNGQIPVSWKEDFEAGGTNPSDPLQGTFFTAENLDAGLSGNNNAEGLINSDGWRCQYSDPDWINAASYNQAQGEVCYPTMNLTHANAVFWQGYGSLVAGSPDGGRAYRGEKSMYFGVFLGQADEAFTSPLSTVESVATNTLLNLGTDDPQLSFWQQISLADNRSINSDPLQNVDRGIVQIKRYDSGGAVISDWMNLQPLQNSYKMQAETNYFNCMFDPTDDGNTEDDFFDPTDPARSQGPSSTCFPEFSWSFMGSTTGAFGVGNIGNADTPPDSTDEPDWGLGTWIQSKIDLSEFRGRRAQLRYIVTSLKATAETHVGQFGPDRDERDDGWWIDDIIIDEILTNPATFDNDEFTMGQCSVNNNSCFNQCKFSLISCIDDNGCGVNEPCMRPCPVGQSCVKPGGNPNPPGCGTTCTTVTPNAWVTPAMFLNPGTVTTPVPGQAVTINGAAPPDALSGALPSSADSCLSGNLQYQFCRDGDPLGDGPNPGDGDCDDPWDLILRSWTENSVITVAPQATADYTMEVRCSTLTSCAASEQTTISVTCPNSDNALGLKAVRFPNPSTMEWSGAPLDVDVWTSSQYTNSSSLASYTGTPFFVANTTSVSTAALNPSPNNVIAILVKADGALNTIPSGLGYFCNSVTWRSGGSAEVPESAPGRDASIGAAP